jgi:hypothetical protein
MRYVKNIEASFSQQIYVEPEKEVPHLSKLFEYSGIWYENAKPDQEM